jgi:hypothetical protein
MQLKLHFMQEKCYFGDMENPVADVAAQASSGLALISRILVKYGTPAEQALGGAQPECPKHFHAWQIDLTQVLSMCSGVVALLVPR